MPIQLKQQSSDLKQLLAFVQLTGASLSFIRDECVWKNDITTPVLTPEMYEAARTSWLKSIKRSRLRQVAGNSNADHPNLPLDYDYRNVILHKDLTEAEQALCFPHTTLTEDLSTLNSLLLRHLLNHNHKQPWQTRIFLQQQQPRPVPPLSRRLLPVPVNVDVQRPVEQHLVHRIREYLMKWKLTASQVV